MTTTRSRKTSPKTRKNNIPSYFRSLKLNLKAGLSDDQAGLFSTMFEDQALSFSCRKDSGGWDLFWSFADDSAPEDDQVQDAFILMAAALELPDALFRSYDLVREEDRNWLAESYRALPPLTIGSFFVYGSHYEGDLPEGKIPLLIEAATAFGSGEHGTTSACMNAIEHVKDSRFAPRNILDMGCGSGILAAAAARLWPGVPVHAADNDPECVIVTKRHLDSNGITNVTAYQSEGYDPGSPVWKDAPYDFIIANILAGPLIDMAAAQSKALAPGGYIILSGTLKEQAERVAAAYIAQDLFLVREFPGDEWMTLLMRKN